MKALLLGSLIISNAFYANAQYDFEKYPSVKHQDYEWEILKNDSELIHQVVVQNFYENAQSLNLQVIYFTEESRDSEINISGIKFKEDIPFTGIGLDPVRIADINGDGLNDIKIISYYMGNGLASLNVRVVYFFQKENRKFTKVVYDDKMGENRLERDFDGDGNFEIITMKMQEHAKHNYWLFNTYNFIDDKLKNVNHKSNYPIMVQVLDKETFKITNKLSRNQMKKYEVENPVNDNY